MEQDKQTLMAAYPEIADDPEEFLVADVHKHWIGLFAIWAIFVIIMIIIVGLIVMLPQFLQLGGLKVDGTLRTSVTFALLIVAALVLIGTLIAAWVYSQSKMLITDQNVIEIKQISLFSRKVSHLNVINVEDVSVVKKGLVQTLLNYGTLGIQTAGATENFSFTNTPTPDDYRRYIIRAHEEAIAKAGQLGSSQRVVISDNTL